MGVKRPDTAGSGACCAPLTRLLGKKGRDVLSGRAVGGEARLPPERGRTCSALPHMRILVITGPSGVGKSTLIRALSLRLPGATAFAVSHTTRGRRGGETDGVHYNFTSDASFAEMVERGDFVEHVCIHGARYGTSRAAISHVVEGGRLPVLDVDLDGALNVDRAFPDSVCGIYVKPSSISLLKQRLTARGTETEAQVEARVSHAAAELARLDAEADLRRTPPVSWEAPRTRRGSDSCSPQACSRPRFRTSASPRPGPCLRQRCAPVFRGCGSATGSTLMRRPSSASWGAKPEGRAHGAAVPAASGQGRGRAIAECV